MIVSLGFVSKIMSTLSNDIDIFALTDCHQEARKLCCLFSGAINRISDGGKNALICDCGDLFKGIQTQQDKEKEYLNSKIPGITNAEWKELSAIGLDIASILNPEAVTGSLMSLGAADLRRRAKNDSNPNWDLGDYFWQGVDYLTGALGGIQVAGDLVLSAKTMATASKAIPILRKIARVGAWADMYHLYPALCYHNSQPKFLYLP